VEKCKITEGHIPDVPIHVGYHRECYCICSMLTKEIFREPARRKDKTGS